MLFSGAFLCPEYEVLIRISNGKSFGIETSVAIFRSETPFRAGLRILLLGRCAMVIPGKVGV